MELLLWVKRDDAMTYDYRLELIGDHYQLTTVVAGDLLSGILLGAEAGVDSFPARRTHLTRAWRQHEALQLAPLAAAVRDGDSASALSLLRGGELSGVHFHEGPADPLQAPHRAHLPAHWRALAGAGSPAQALALAARLRLLTAVRDGPQGARTLNARIEAMLGEAGTHFHGRLLLVTENSYRHRLFNGDIGVCFRDADRTVMA